MTVGLDSADGESGLPGLPRHFKRDALTTGPSKNVPGTIEVHAAGTGTRLRIRLSTIHSVEVDPEARNQGIVVFAPGGPRAAIGTRETYEQLCALWYECIEGVEAHGRGY